MENDIITHWSIEGVANLAAPVEQGIHDGSTVAVTDTAGHEALFADFIDAVKNDGAPLVSGKSSTLGVELILKIYEAAGVKITSPPCGKAATFGSLGPYGP